MYAPLLKHWFYFSSPKMNCLKDLLQAETYPKLGSIVRALWPFTISDHQALRFSSLVSLAVLFQSAWPLTGQLLINSFLTSRTVSVIRDLKQSNKPPQLTFQRCCPRGSGVPMVERTAGGFCDSGQPDGRCCCRERQMKMIPFSRCLCQRSSNTREGQV